MEDLILVVYIGIKNVPPPELDNFINRVVDIMESNPNHPLTYYIPVQEQDSRMECLNPRIISKEELISTKKTLEEITKILEELKK
jgi:hypothetical protein